jgi:hypothetical protein
MRVKLAVIGLAALGSVALVSGSASAMPNGLPQAGQITGQTANVDQVRWVCNPWGRCHWRPNFYGAYGYYGPRRFYGPGRYWGPRPWGWHHRHWHRW